ncbi:MAG TPA: aminoacyl-tRNA hydrolase [Burkholderiaceae bacterium]|nr:aminoacyl-tRNA hydrolase [Burkholderiaceae bacterium]
MAASNAESQGIRLIVGLGNVGAQYARSRHNAGFWFVDHVASVLGAQFRAERKFSGELARVAIGGGDVWLLKPATFMNLSGQAVVAAALYYRLLPDQILVAHDELDLAPGDVRLKRGGGVAGHNGLKDVRARLSSAEFWRLRIGIGHPRNWQLHQDVADYVLHAPPREQQDAIEAAIDRARTILDLTAAGRLDLATMQLRTAAAKAAAAQRAPMNP